MDTSSNKIIELGYIPKTENGGDGKPHQSNLVYSINGISPCVAASWCVKQPAGMIIVDDLYENKSPRIYKDYAPTLRSERFGLKVIKPY